MQNVRGRRAPGLNTQDEHMYEDFKPAMDWTQDSIAHMLIIDLPGFKKEDLNLQVDKNRILMASGERQVAEGKYKRFKHIFTVPEDSNTDKITAKFEHGILFIIMPKNIEKKAEETAEKGLLKPGTAEKEPKPVTAEKELPKPEPAEKVPKPVTAEKVPRLETAEKELPKPETTDKVPKPVTAEKLPTPITAEKELPKPETAEKVPKPKIAKKEVPSSNGVTTKKEDSPPIKAEGVQGTATTKQEEAPLQEEKGKDGVGGQKVMHGAEDRHKNEKDGSLKQDDQIKQREKVVKFRESDRLPTNAEAGVKILREKVWSLSWMNEKLKEGLGLEEGFGESLLDMARKNKEAITTAVVAFTIGFYVSRKLSRSSG